MQVLIIYYSRSGNTEKLASEIAKGVTEVEDVSYIMKPVAEVTREDFLGSEGIIAGSPVYFGTMASELKETLDKFVSIRPKMGNKVGAAFATGGAVAGGIETTLISIIEAFLIYGMIVVGDPLDATGHYGIACIGSPDEKVSLNARKLGKRVASLVKKLNN